MKNIHIPAFILSTILLIVAFSALSASSMPEELRFSWTGLNPWNGVEGLAFTVGYFLHTGYALTWAITIAVVFLIWWRLYAIFNRMFNRN